MKLDLKEAKERPKMVQKWTKNGQKWTKKMDKKWTKN